MQIKIHSVADLGLALRATRKGSKIRLDDLADIARVSKQFVSDVERGKPTVQLGLVLKLLAEMGVSLAVDIPSAALGEWEKLQAKSVAAPHAEKAS
jgi:transcriptional regulator with XRE-family HTH domain